VIDCELLQPSTAVVVTWCTVVHDIDYIWFSLPDDVIWFSLRQLCIVKISFPIPTLSVVFILFLVFSCCSCATLKISWLWLIGLHWMKYRSIVLYSVLRGMLYMQCFCVAIGVECSTVVYRILPHLSLSLCFSIWLTFVMHLWSRFSSVLWHCWLGGRKGIRPVKTWAVGCWCGCWSGARCRLAYGPADATATHCNLLQ